MPPLAGRISTAAFCAIFGERPATFREMSRLGRTPFDLPERSGRKHPTFDGVDVLTYELHHQLRRRGQTGEQAAETMRFAEPVQFISAMESGKDVRLLCLIAWATAERNALGYFETLGSKIGDPEDVTWLIERDAERYGAEFSRGEADAIAPRTRAGLRFLEIVPVLPIYDLAKRRAREAGYVLDGRNVMKAAPEAEE